MQPFVAPQSNCVKHPMLSHRVAFCEGHSLDGMHCLLRFARQTFQDPLLVRLFCPQARFVCNFRERGVEAKGSFVKMSFLERCLLTVLLTLFLLATRRSYHYCISYTLANKRNGHPGQSTKLAGFAVNDVKKEKSPKLCFAHISHIKQQTERCQKESLRRSRQANTHFADRQATRQASRQKASLQDRSTSKKATRL